MATRRRKTWIVASAITIATIAVMAIAGELVARSQLDARVADVASALPGVSTSLAGGPALAQLAAGRIGIELAVSDSALGAYADCRSTQELTVRSVDGGLVVSAVRVVRGMTLPVDVTLIPRQQGDSWSLVADSVSAAGISLPADRALRVLAGKDGAGAKLATRLLDGVPLPSDARLTLTSVRFTDGAALVTASTAIDRTDDAQGSRLSDLRSCLATQEG